MGLYLYQNPINGEIKEIFQNMNDNHSYEENGIKWARLWTKPQAAISTISKIDPNNERQFVDVVGQKRGNLGQIMDLSAELSQKRESKEGTDKVKQKFYDNYAQKRGGRRHIREKKENLKKTINENPNSPFTIDI